MNDQWHIKTDAQDDFSLCGVHWKKHGMHLTVKQMIDEDDIVGCCPICLTLFFDILWYRNMEKQHLVTEVKRPRPIF